MGCQDYRMFSYIYVSLINSTNFKDIVRMNINVLTYFKNYLFNQKDVISSNDFRRLFQQWPYYTQILLIYSLVNHKIIQSEVFSGTYRMSVLIHVHNFLPDSY